MRSSQNQKYVMYSLWKTKKKFSPAKVRISENNTKESSLFFLLSSESTFDEVRGTIATPHFAPLGQRISEDNTKGIVNNFKKEVQLIPVRDSHTTTLLHYYICYLYIIIIRMKYPEYII